MAVMRVGIKGARTEAGGRELFMASFIAHSTLLKLIGEGGFDLPPRHTAWNQRSRPIARRRVTGMLYSSASSWHGFSLNMIVKSPN